ncbi:aminoglycoside adenylyltransferase family protein [Mitsuaria sp. GD03876]|uniref:aminoglycoside adenylyltransferase family protein n=1 Tax=Mitsuaria sp. GD03876 TaxID=2975399 RepID=UPI00244841A1|nr:aminoglycoside adenylyltransferase family protein [Mitsuaria sp. GD03876]MDH0864570.1 aminoglycoside adenylyltransferase family protein [Mitsuaria sp. GD03876]
MHTDANTDANTEAQLADVQAVLTRHLGADLVAVHLYGSAMAGGLKPQSDLDLMVTVAAPMTDATREALMRELLAHSAPPLNSDERRPLEVTVVARDEVVPWRHPARREMQFGEWLREDIEAGRFEPGMTDPDLAILITKLRQHSACLHGPEAAVLFEPVPPADFRRALLDTIAQWNEPADWEGDEQTVVLALARIWYSVCTGGIASKDAAAAWAIDRLPPNHAAVMARAAAAYVDGRPDDLARDPGPLAAAIHFCKTEIQRAAG